MNSNWKNRVQSYKNALIAAGIIALIVIGVTVWLISRPEVNPVPVSVKRQADFPIIYPASYSFDPNSWKYTGSQDSVTFTAQKSNYSVVFTEEKVPLAFQNDQAAYDRFIGSLRPFANFNTNLGPVSLTNFVTAGDYQPVGGTGILNTHGTFLLAHPSRNLQDTEWRDLFNSLKVGG